MDDKRRSHRLNIQLPVRFQIDGLDHPLSDEVAVLNINAKGICFVVAEDVSAGQDLLLSVSLPDGQDLKIRTKVIWVKEMEKGKRSVGVQVQDVDQGDEAKFVRFYANKLLEISKSESFQAEK